MREKCTLSLLSFTLIVKWMSLHFGQNKAVDDVVLGFVPVSDFTPSGIGLMTAGKQAISRQKEAEGF